MWDLAATRVFFACSCYRGMISALEWWRFFEILWKWKLPLIVCLFMWLVLRERIVMTIGVVVNRIESSYGRNGGFEPDFCVGLLCMLKGKLTQSKASFNVGALHNLFGD